MALKGQSTKKSYSKNDFSLEMLRALSSGVPQDSTSNNSQEIYVKERREFERRLKQSENLRRQDRLIFSSNEQQVKSKVQTLQNELLKLSNSIQNLSKEIKVTAVQTMVDPGIYHVSFFERLISFVKSLAKNVEDSNSWLVLANARGKKKSHYWGQVKKSGSKYLLSADRYMSTQAG